MMNECNGVVPVQQTTLKIDFDGGEQEGQLLHSPNDTDNEENSQCEKDNSPSNMAKPNIMKTLQNYLELEALKETEYKLTDILHDLHENQENIEQVGYVISIVKKYIENIIQINRGGEGTTIFPPEKIDKDLNHEMTVVVQQIRNSNITDEEREYVCQSLQLATNLYNEQKLIVANYSKRRQLVTNFPFGIYQATNTIPSNVPLHIRTDTNDPDDLELERRHQQGMQVKLDIAQKKAQDTAMALARALGRIRDQDVIIKQLISKNRDKPIADMKKTSHDNHQKNGNRLNDYDQSIYTETTSADLSTSIPHEISKLTNDYHYATFNPNYDSDSDQTDDADTFISLGARQKVDPRTESLLVKLEAKSKELRAKIEFCYSSIIFDEQTLATYIDSEICDAYKMNTIMLKQAEKLQEIHHTTDETFIRTIKYLTFERKKQIEDLLQNAYKAYNDILKTIRNIRMEMRSRSLVTHNMASHIAKNIVMPEFDGESLPHVLWFKKELNILLEKQNIAKSSRGFFIRRQIKGAAATVLTTELKNHSYPSADVIYRILETHYGENYYILGLLAKEHAKIGKIPGNDKNWSRIYETTTKHVALIRQMKALEEAQVGKESPIDGQYVTGLFYYLGQKRQSVLASQQGYFNLSTKEKLEMLKRTFINLELISSKAQISNSNIQQNETIDDFGGISGNLDETELLQAIQLDGCPQYEGSYLESIPNPNIMTIPPTEPSAWEQLPHETFEDGNLDETKIQKDLLEAIELDGCPQYEGSYSESIPDPNIMTIPPTEQSAWEQLPHVTFDDGNLDETKILKDLLEAIELDGCPQNEGSYSDPNIMTIPPTKPSAWTQLPHVPIPHPPYPVYSCIICKTKARIDQTHLKLSQHPVNIRGKLLREGCPVLMEQQNIKARQDLLVRLNICLACLSCSLDDPTHGETICSFPYANMICNEPSCNVRKTVCDTHKDINESMLQQTNEIYHQLGLSLVII